MTISTSLECLSGEAGAELLAERGRKSDLCHRVLTDDFGGLGPRLWTVAVLADATEHEAWRERLAPDGSTVSNPNMVDWLTQPWPAGLGTTVEHVLSTLDTFATADDAAAVARIKAEIEKEPAHV